MSRWVYWVSLLAIAVVILYPVVRLSMDPQAEWKDIFRKGIDLDGGTSLIYDLRSTDPKAPPPDAGESKSIIMRRIDPTGTRGYIVRPLGAHRLEIVIPGRATRVDIQPQAVTADLLTTAETAAAAQKNPDIAKLLKTNSQAYLGGAVLKAQLNPPLYLQDVQDRMSRALIERLPDQVGNVAVVGLEASGDQWSKVQIFVSSPSTNAQQMDRWSKVMTTALSAQRDVTEVKRLVRQSGFLEFRIVADRNSQRDVDFDALLKAKQNGTTYDTTLWGWYPMKKGWELYNARTAQGTNALDSMGYVYTVDEKAQTIQVLLIVGDGCSITGADLARAVPTRQGGENIVAFDMRTEANARFAKLTNARMVGRHMAIILDGVIQTAPVLQATLSGGGIITGYDDKREVDEVVRVLNSGKLAASLGDPVTTRTVSSELGADNIHYGLWAALIGVLIVMVFMAVYYLFAGVVANVALILNLVLTICLMFWIRQAWTLPGIAGLILALAMAVDANVLIYERLREEKGKEGSLGFALKKAYARAFTTIFDSNLTTVIPAIVLLMGLATEEVKGFALVMVIGLGVSMFTSVVVTRMIFETGIKLGFIKELKMLHFFEKPNLDWMKFAKFAFVSTLAISVVGILVFLARGDDKYDIEFVGGTQVELALKPPAGEKKVAIELVRDRSNKALGGIVTVQEMEFTGEETSAVPLSRFLISVPAAGVKIYREAEVKSALAAAFKDMEPPGTKQDIETVASPLTPDILHRRVEAATLPAAVTGTAPAATGTATAAPASDYLPDELHVYLGGIRVQATLKPPMTLAEIKRRIDVSLRESHPEIIKAGLPYDIEAGKAGGRPGELESFEVWVGDVYTGVRADSPNPKFWSEVVTTALRREEAFASTNSVAPTMAAEAWSKAIIAIIVSLVAMAIYIWFRFAKFSSGIAAVVATLHDVLITLGAVTAGSLIAIAWGTNFLQLTDMKVNLPLIGAFLTLVGYSVNDTIVVFDRIRENRGKYGDLSPAIINNSINQTLSRTVLTSSTVFLAVIALYFLGGETSSIHGIGFVMLIGCIVGCYSSIAIASPILVMTDYLKRLYAWTFPIVSAGVLVYFLGVWRVTATAMDYYMGSGGSFAALFPSDDPTKPFAATLAHYMSAQSSAFFGSWVGWAVIILAALWAVWVLVTTWGSFAITHGRPWTLQLKAPMAVKAIALVSLAAPVLTVLFFAITALGKDGMATWAGPECVGALASCPATYLFYRLAFIKKAQNN
jgi:SecD/SecF fusion protein